MYPTYDAVQAGVARVMADAPYSDGTIALEIKNFSMDESGVLDSTFRVMPFIPNVWNGSAQPDPFTQGVSAIGFFERDGEAPELIFVAGVTGTVTHLWRYAPWTRQAATGSYDGLQPIYQYPRAGVSAGVFTQNRTKFPPQVVAAHGRAYVSFCDGGQLWATDGDRAWPLGYTQQPSAPDAEGPSSGSSHDPNNMGLALSGRIGSTEGGWTDNLGDVVGGVDTGRWRYAVVFENAEGGYSSMSPLGGQVSLDVALASTSTEPKQLQRRFRVLSIPQGPAGTVARVLLRTANLERLPESDDGSPHFLHRIANNEATEWIDDTPDGELGPVWENRMEVPFGAYLLATHSGSLFFARTDGYPARIWWSEQTASGPVFESILEGHWLDVYPDTGGITCLLPFKGAGEAGPPILIVGKAGAVHFIHGEYPEWGRGTLHHRAGIAGPGVAQVCPDGAAVWYGSGTFWRLTGDGMVQDVGGPIRRYLKRVNTTEAHMGVSWVNQRTSETTFVLPTDDETHPNFQFVWDPRLQGWRIREDFTYITAALTLPDGLTLLAANWDKLHTVWLYQRGYTRWTLEAPAWRYITGWVALPGTRRGGRTLPHTHQVPTDLVLTLEERSDGVGAVSVYQDWDLDTVRSTETVLFCAPNDDGVPIYNTPFSLDAAVYSSSVYRSRRVITQRVAIGVQSGEVFAIELSGTAPIGLHALAGFGPAVAMPGGRTPST